MGFKDFYNGIDANHTSVFSNILTGMIFTIPTFLFFFLKVKPLIIMIYNYGIIFLLVSAISNRMFPNEVNKK
jgi:hypothetical protein